jgi:tetratricopeptide (TPR) repeat protein
MIRYAAILFLSLCGLGISAAPVQTNLVALFQRQWFETRTTHFNIFSCSAAQPVARLGAKLEQFCEAYSLLAGAQSVASPPIVVIAFPDHESMIPFLPLYQGQPGNFAGFFIRDSDENLIVLSLPETDSVRSDMEVIFHEYTHLLLRHNERVWPLWLTEGMAEMYSTFQTAGFNVRIGDPLKHHLSLLKTEPLLPLAKLFAVNHDSPGYNEKEHQGIFYAEAWLLTHYLVAGDNPVYKARFGQFTKLLRDGQSPEQAFTNALQVSLPAMETEVRRYLANGKFAPIQFPLSKNLSSPQMMSRRALAPVETYFRLGDELLRVEQGNLAEKYFSQAQKLAPASPLPYEGLGLLSAQREKHALALRYLNEALQRGSTSFLAYFVRAREQYRLTADAEERYAPVDAPTAKEIRGLLKKSIAWMPNFGPAHELLGFFEMVQGENFVVSETQLRLAIQLEPENLSYRFSLAQSQLRERDANAARATLKPLLRSTVEAKLRAHAQELMQKIDRDFPSH